MSGLVLIPLVSFLIGLLVGMLGTVLYMRRKMQKLLENPFTEMADSFEDLDSQ